MEPKRSSDIDLVTLAIAAAAGAAAAYVTSQVWAGGTLVTAALTPVIVTLVKEALARPADKIQTLRTERRTTEHPQIIDPTRPDEPYVTVYGQGVSAHRWKVALASAAAAFALIVGVFTIPELVAGRSIGRGGDSGTTLFGGKTRKQKREKHPTGASKTKTATPTPEATETPEETPTPGKTATPRPTPAKTSAPTTVPTVLATPTQ
jgi:hypothetical protein